MTVQTMIQGTQPGIPKPCDNSFRRQIEDINSKVTIIQDELQEIQQKINEVQGGGPIGDNDTRTQLRAKLNECQDRLSLYENQRNANQERLADYQRKITSHNQEIVQRRNQLMYQSLDQVKARVLELQAELNKTNISLTQEKKIINDISQIKQQIPSIKASLKAVEQLESNKPDYSTEISTLQSEMEELRTKIDAERRARREIQDELRNLVTSEQEARKDRSKVLDELVMRREQLTEARDEQTSILLAAQSKFNQELSEYREYEAQKKRAQVEKMRERKKQERQQIERQQLLEQIADCVVEVDDAEDGTQKISQLYNYCLGEIDRLEQEADDKTPKKKKKAALDIAIIAEFGFYNIQVPSTIEEYKNAIEILEPIYKKQMSANDKMFEAVAQRRAALVEKLAAFDKAIEAENMKQTE